MIIIVCFYHYARGARVNPPPLGFMLNVCDSVHELKLFLGTPLWDFGTFEPPPRYPHSDCFVSRLLLSDGEHGD